MDFNLQQYLGEMREENREDHKATNEKLDRALGRINNHETRIVVVEGTRKIILWLAGVTIVALLGSAFDYAFNHAGNKPVERTQRIDKTP